jgi:polar amino acid transport system permease protein
LEAILDNLIYILNGVGTTVKLAVGTAVLSIPIGAIVAIGKVSGGKVLKTIFSFYTWLFRGTPLLLQLFFVYYGLPILSPSLAISSGFTAALITFVLNYAAYFTEIFRGGIESIDKGQYEASKAMGFNYRQTMVHIIFPQTLRRIIPTTSSEMVNLVKDTALVTAIGLGDLLRSSREIVTREFIISPFVIAAVVYLLLNSIIMYGFKTLEERTKMYE